MVTLENVVMFNEACGVHRVILYYVLCLLKGKYVFCKTNARWQRRSLLNYFVLAARAFLARFWCIFKLSFQVKNQVGKGY